MRKERNAIKAGLFIVVSVGLALTVVFLIRGAGRLAEPQQFRTVSFKLSDDIGGLRTGDDVRVGGYQVGSIQSIETVGLDGNDARMHVRIMLPAKFKFHEDAKIGVQTTLTGTSVLNVESLGTGPLLVEGHHLPGQPDAKAALFAGLNDTIPELRSTAKSATQFVKHLDEKVDPLSGKVVAIADKATMVADKAGTVMDSVNGVVGPAGPDIRGTAANLNAVTGSLKEKLPSMIDKVNQTIDSARTALEEVNQTVVNAKEISASVKTVIAGNRGKLESVIASVKTTADNLKAASTEIRHSPWRLLYQPKTEELSNLNLFDAAREFADGANELNDASQALRDAMKDKNTDPQQMQQLINRLEKTFANFHDVEQKLWKDVKE